MDATKGDEFHLNSSPQLQPVSEEFPQRPIRPARETPVAPIQDASRRSSSSLRDDEKSPLDQVPLEKDSPSSAGSGSEALDSDPIVWHYLTFETELPRPTHLASVSNNGKEPPEAPDLTAYIDPFKWSSARKNALVWIGTIATLLTAWSVGDYGAGVDQMSAEFNLSTTVILTGYPALTTGFAIAPMILAPLSEVNGRRPIILATGFVFFVADLCCGLTRIFGGMIAARFISGCANSTFSTIVGGVLADIYEAKDRNTPMTIFTGGAIFGIGVGPLVSGFIAQHTSWRWIFYSHSILLVALFAVLVFFFKETRGHVLLSRKARTLNAWYEAREAAGYYGFDMPIEGSSKTQSQRIRWKVKADEQRATLLKMMKISLIRPFYMLFTEPVVFFFSLWISFAWSLLFCTFSVIPYVYERVYDFSLQESGAVFASICVGAVLSTFLCIWQEKISTRYGLLNASPEARLAFTCIESAFLPVAVFWFGWTSSPSIHWIVPTISLSFATVGIFSIYLAVFNYFADTYRIYASSALAAQSFCRNLMGGAFPLFTDQIFGKLGYGPAGSLLGGIGVVLTFVPWVLFYFGAKIRARSKMASEVMAGT